MWAPTVACGGTDGGKGAGGGEGASEAYVELRGVNVCEGGRVDVCVWRLGENVSFCRS